MSLIANFSPWQGAGFPLALLLEESICKRQREQQRELDVLGCACSFPLSKWALELNELTPELHAKLPPTDDRLRPDMRLFEHGHFHEVRLRSNVFQAPSMLQLQSKAE